MLESYEAEREDYSVGGPVITLRLSLEYTVVFGTCRTICDNVTEQIKNGWVPLGGLCYRGEIGDEGVETYAQAMTRTINNAS